MKKMALILFILISSVTAQVTSEFIFTDECKPTPQCHASTIVETRAGALLAAWFGGTEERHPDVGIWLSRCEAGQWSKPVEAANGAWTLGRRFPCWNPVLVQPSQGPLYLFFKVGSRPDSWWGEMMISADEGRTWQQRRTLPQGGIGPVKNKVIELSDGSLLCPSSSEHDRWRVHFEITKDGGLTWQTIGPINLGTDDPAIQPTILCHPDGRLQALCRAQRAGFILQTWSSDQGQTWSALQRTTLPNPNSGIDAVTLADGRFLLVYNPLRTGRNKLSVALSNNGVDWQDRLVLEDQPTGEFSYPAVIQTRDGLVHITYTHLRNSIKHTVLHLHDLE